MPARVVATNRQSATGRQNASERISASGRQNVSGGAADDMIFIAETVVGVGGAANITFSAIPGTYRHLMILYVARSSDQAGAQILRLQFNGDTAGNYDRQIIQANNVTVVTGGVGASTFIQVGYASGTGAPAGAFASGMLYFPYYATTTQDKGVVASDFNSLNTTNADQVLDIWGGAWRTSNAAITSIVLFPAAGNLVQFTSASLYGIT